MLKKMTKIVQESPYRALENRLSRLGFYRKHYDTDGQRIADVVGGAVFLSHRTNHSGDHLMVLVPGPGISTIRVTGFNTAQDKVVSTCADETYLNLESLDEVAAISAESLRVFQHGETVQQDNAVSAAGVRRSTPTFR